MITQTLTVAPILGCLKAAEEYLRTQLTFKTANDTQVEFVKRFASNIADLERLGNEIKSVAHKDVAVINRFLKDRGFDIQLPPPSNPSMAFSVASVLDVLVEWLKEGKVTTVKSVNTGQSYPAVHIKAGVNIYRGLNDMPLVQLDTKSGDLVYMMPVLDIPEGKFGIAKLIDSTNTGSLCDEYEGVIFPMIDYDQQVDISWIEGMYVTPDVYIEKAIQQTKFRMNEKGARAQSAAAMTMRCMSLEPHRSPVVIDRPFLLWIAREDIEFPVFAGIFCEDMWKKPANLD